MNPVFAGIRVVCLICADRSFLGENNFKNAGAYVDAFIQEKELTLKCINGDTVVFGRAYNIFRAVHFHIRFINVNQFKLVFLGM